MTSDGYPRFRRGAFRLRLTEVALIALAIPGLACAVGAAAAGPPAAHRFSLDDAGRIVSTGSGQPSGAGLLMRRAGAMRSGDVAAVVSDHHGGWYVGGAFQARGGLHNLVHLYRRGEIDRRFRPQPDGGIDALALHQGVLYVGGSFGRLGGRRRVALGAVSAVTGGARRWRPAVRPVPPASRYGVRHQPYVYALAIRGDAIYVGGGLLQAFDLRSARAVQVPRVAEVMAFATRGPTLYFGGAFLSAAGQPRHRLGALDLRTRHLLPFAPAVECDCSNPMLDPLHIPPVDQPLFTGPVPGTPPSLVRALTPALVDDNTWVDALMLVAGRLYLGGNFNSIDGQRRRFIAALNPATGKPDAFAPSIDGPVLALASAGKRVLVGSGYRSFHNQAGEWASAFNAHTGTRVPWRPRPAGPVQALASSGESAYVGGAVVRCRPNDGPCSPDTRRFGPSTHTTDRGKGRHRR